MRINHLDSCICVIRVTNGHTRYLVYIQGLCVFACVCLVYFRVRERVEDCLFVVSVVSVYSLDLCCLNTCVLINN